MSVPTFSSVATTDTPNTGRGKWNSGVADIISNAIFLSPASVQTGNLWISGSITAGSFTLAGLNLSGLTASRLVATDGSKNLVSSPAASWISGTTNRVTVTDDADGTITLTGPQDIHSGASPTFLRATLSQATGTSPFSITSTTVNTNLNADLLDGNHASAFQTSARSLTMVGTTNRISVSPTGAQDLSADRTWTFTGPQDLHTAASPTFANATISSFLNVGAGASTSEQIFNVGGATGSICAISITQAAIVAWRIGVTASDNVLKFDGSSGTLATPKFQIDASGNTRQTGQITINTTTPDIIAQVAGVEKWQTVMDGTSWRIYNTALAANAVVIAAADSGVKFTGALSSPTYASQTTGWKITASGDADFRYLFVDEMHVKSFIADLEQALAGGQIICKSVAKIKSFTSPAAGGTATLVVESFAGFQDAKVFVNSDVIRIRTFSRTNLDLTIWDCWGTITWVSTDTTAKTQTYTFLRSSAPNAGDMGTSQVVPEGTLALDYGTTGNGYYEVNAIDGANAVNSPYAQIVTWTTHPAVSTNLSVRARLGNIVAIQTTTFGTLAGYGLYSNNLYLEGNAKIVGTLAVGGTTTTGAQQISPSFYAGKIKVQLLSVDSELFTTWTDPGSSGITLSDRFAGILTPDGGQNATRWVRSGGTNPYRFNNTTTAVGTKTFTLSVWARGASGGEAFTMDIARWTDYAGIASLAVTLTSAFKRYVVTGTSTATGAQLAYTVYAQLTQGDNSTTIYVYGAQLEESPDASPYQPTDGVGSSATEVYGMWANVGGFGGYMQNPVVAVSSQGLSVKTAASTLYLSSTNDGVYIGNYAPHGVATFTGVIISKSDGFRAYKTGSTSPFISLPTSGTATIAGWNLSLDRIASADTTGTSKPSVIMSSAVSGLNSVSNWYQSQSNLTGFSIRWWSSYNAGHLVLGRIAGSATTLKTNNPNSRTLQDYGEGASVGVWYGLQMMDHEGNDYFTLSALVNAVGSGAAIHDTYNTIAGWSFDSTKLSHTNGTATVRLESTWNGSSGFSGLGVAISSTDRLKVGKFAMSTPSPTLSNMSTSVYDYANVLNFLSTAGGWSIRFVNASGPTATRDGTTGHNATGALKVNLSSLTCPATGAFEAVVYKQFTRSDDLLLMVGKHIKISVWLYGGAAPPGVAIVGAHDWSQRFTHTSVGSPGAAWSEYTADFVVPSLATSYFELALRFYGTAISTGNQGLSDIFVDDVKVEIYNDTYLFANDTGLQIYASDKLKSVMTSGSMILTGASLMVDSRPVATVHNSGTTPAFGTLGDVWVNGSVVKIYTANGWITVS